MSDRLDAGDDLAIIGAIASQDGRSKLMLQPDGNLVLSQFSGAACWATGTNGRQVSQAIMQGDGNLVMLRTCWEVYPGHRCRRASGSLDDPAGRWKRSDL